MGNQELITGLNNLAKQIHEDNVKKGFWDKPREMGTILALVCSELYEGLEADRKGRYCDLNKELREEMEPDNWEHAQIDTVKNFEDFVKDTFEDEIADTIIRLLDLAGNKNIDLEKRINNLISQELGVEFNFNTIDNINKLSRLLFDEYYSVNKIWDNNNLETGSMILILNKNICDISKEYMSLDLPETLMLLLLFSEYHSIDIQWHIEQKLNYNRTRERLHGKKY